MSIYIKTNSFDIAKTFECGQCFRFNKIDNNSYRGIAYGKELTLTQRANGVEIFGITEHEFNNTFYNYFDLGRDYQKVDALLQNDSVLKDVIPYSKGIRILNQQPFETLVSFIISASNNIPRIKKIIASLCQNFGQKIGDDAYAFPTPDALASLDVSDLSVIKAGFRDKYIIDCAKKVQSGVIDFEHAKTLSLGDAREHLKAVNGVGDKVADCALLFSLGHINSFPKDVWIKRVLKTFYNTDTNADLNFFGYDGIAQQYLFYYAINNNIMEDKKQYELVRV